MPLMCIARQLILLTVGGDSHPGKERAYDVNVSTPM